MNILRRAGGAVEHIWRSYPFIGIIVLFIGLGFGVFEGSKARQFAEKSVAIAHRNEDTLAELKKTQQDAIAEKDRRIAEKDTQITNATIVIGQLYDDAIALQQQVIMLHGNPKPIPVQIPQLKTSGIAPPKAVPAPSKVITVPTIPVTTTVNYCKLGIEVAPLNLAEVHVCIPPKGS